MARKTHNLVVRVGGQDQTLVLKEPTIGQRRRAQAANDGTGVGALLHLIAQINNINIDDPLIEALEMEHFNEAQDFFDAINNSVDPNALDFPLDAPEVTITFEPYDSVTSGVMYNQMVLRRPKMKQIDNILKSARKPTLDGNTEIDQEKATMEYITKLGNIPLQDALNMPSTAFDRAVLYFYSFLGLMVRQPTKKTSETSSNSDVVFH